MSGDWNEQIKARRKSAGMSRRELANRAGVSVASVNSWESARRHPSRAVLERVMACLGFNDQERAALMRSIGLEPAAGRRYAALARLARPVSALSAEMEHYPWPALVTDENYEIIAWNQAANGVAELDFGADLATPGARQLLRMAASDHFFAKLVNWDTVVGHLVAFYKMEGRELGKETPNPYFQALVEYLIQHHPDLVGRLFGIWQTTEVTDQARVNQMPIEWLASDGTALRFDAVFTTLDDYDAAWAFDWHPSNGATWEWINAHRAVAPAGDNYLAPFTAAGHDWRELIRLGRESAGLTRQETADRSGGELSAHTIDAYERGKRFPSREKLVAFAEAVRLDGMHTNSLLRAAGMEPEPSDFARFLMREPSRFDPSRHPGGEQPDGSSPAQLNEDFAADEWPALAVDGHAEIVAANTLFLKILGLEREALNSPGLHRNLIHVLSNGPARERLENWGEVVAALVPVGFEPYATRSNRYIEPGTSMDEAVRRLRADAAAVAELKRVVGGGAGNPPVRTTCAVEWHEDGVELTFNCIIAPHNVSDAVWSVAWYPADAETWGWIRRQAG
jgi:transcriptional regulator with XRE-family HTH domain